MKHAIRRFPALWRTTRLARRWYHARFGAYPDWQQALSSDAPLWESARESAHGGPRVLLGTAIGSYAHAITLESALATALTLRGAEVHALLCDGAMTACAECEASLYPSVAKFVANGPSRDLCRDCVWPAERVYAAARAEDSPLLRLAHSRRSGGGAPDCQHVAVRSDRRLHARRHGHRRACPRRRAAVLRDRLARGRSGGRTGASQVSRIGAADGVCLAPADSQRRLLLGRFHPWHLRAMGHRRRGCAGRRRARRHVERCLPEAAVHLQPR